MAEEAPQATEGQSTRATFNECMRLVDSCIKQRDTAGARSKLQEARALNPNSPYIGAFEERIRLLDLELQRGGGKDLFTSPSQPARTAPPAITPKPVHPAIARPSAPPAPQAPPSQAGQQSVPAPPQAQDDGAINSMLQSQQERLAKQEQVLQGKYDEKIFELQTKYEHEYKTRLESELRQAEERLRKEYASRQDGELGSIMDRLEKDHQARIRVLEDQLNGDYATKLDKERAAHAANEKKLVDQFNLILTEKLREHESHSQSQAASEKQKGEASLRESLTKEFEQHREKERKEFEAHYREVQDQFAHSREEERRKLEAAFQAQMKERIDQITQEQTLEFERKRGQLRDEIESSYQKTLEERIAAERQNAQREAREAFEAEKAILQKDMEAITEREAERVKRTRMEVRAEMERRFLGKMESIVSQFEKKMELLGVEVPAAIPERVALYRSKLLAAYANGEPNITSATKLMELKELLELSYDQHVEVETEVRHTMFVQTLEKDIASGKLKVSDTARIQELKTAFGITPDEGSWLETQIWKTFERLTKKARIMVAEDEDLIRNELAEFLEEHGYQIIRCSTVESALEILKVETVDMILSDINFAPKMANGFKFFKSVQEMPQHRAVPFIFLSAMADDLFVRSGLQLGVDDYLTKPVDFDMLLAVVEGKLKRLGKLPR